MTSSLLKEEIQQRRPFVSLEEEAFLNLQRTSNALLQALTRALKTHALTPTQYNVLRILRGSHPGTLTCGDIGGRMVTPEPDVTPPLDRLEKPGPVSRARDAGPLRGGGNSPVGGLGGGRPAPARARRTASCITL